ncbi:hypothetical protein AAA799E16_01224 [Marine Group I thaumarchaeote SCGC AAA799-E16]|uniref:Uncharacterized protein n=4 Tax=Marine Group I TaxID=905826 RepID=A0A087S7P2_9ARCH|nr:hypothetical protein AAA799N04_00917 [Marine Group I thaumarchaeote SCGC AAA799-N04]KER06047.1 hypothetical protein AAA799E16_01224 [Marine Group I thaumarchaeote SCGC AAA799-E16]KFM18171.1 hypothetical protein SCCGRSA3_01312 [Marine Group I thaumarchaeote SCGC RSA3]KFM21746.1 hypothetical protein AAA799B03_00695 [Marine Group I thaumarchaeote SCGC AAA799-B03]
MKIAILLALLLTLSSGFAFAEPVSTKIPSGEKTYYVDEQIMIMADISNNQDVPQNFAYLTQVKNDQGVVISLSWLTGSLSPRQSFSPAQSWTPTETGTFHVQVFVWESIDNPEALSPPLSMIINVEQRST